MKNFAKKIIFILIVLGFLTIAFEVWALQVNWPDSPLGTPLTDKSNFTDLVKYLYEWGIFLGGLAVFIAFLIAGFQYLTSVGNPTLMKESWARIQSALFGLILLLSSWLILHTINPELTVLRPPVFTPGGGYRPGEKGIELGELFKVCEALKVTTAATRAGLEGGTTYDLPQNECIDVKPAIRHLRSEAFVKGESSLACSGQLIVYAGSDCEEEITTLAPNTSYFRLGRRANSLMLYVEKPLKEAPTAISCTLSASPSTIYLGETTTITWTTSYANSFSISPSIGTRRLALNGSAIIRPNRTGAFTYTGTAVYLDSFTYQTARCAIRIEVLSRGTR